MRTQVLSVITLLLLLPLSAPTAQRSAAGTEPEPGDQLQVFPRDIWVDEAGDTMTGTLTLDPVDDKALDVSTGNIYKGGVLFIHASASNTAIGKQALMNTTVFGFLGNLNTATGYRSLYSNTYGSGNTATGWRALSNNTTGSFNTANGQAALFSNTTGNSNTAIGDRALDYNTTGYQNAAIGYSALRYNTAGVGNTAFGSSALRNTTGSSNIAIGDYSGYYQTTGSSNIAIGNRGVVGESSTIRIGDSTHSRSFIAGIRGVTTGVADAITVMIDSNGQLGTVSSSRRVKENIVDMGDSTERLLDLRTVLFRYKARNANGDGPIEFGLIAEEVAEVFPELVVYDDEGEPFTVRYHLLSTMLLNELQKHVGEKDAELAELRAEVAEVKEQLARLAQDRSG